MKTMLLALICGLGFSNQAFAEDSSQLKIETRSPFFLPPNKVELSWNTSFAALDFMKQTLANKQKIDQAMAWLENQGLLDKGDYDLQLVFENGFPVGYELDYRFTSSLALTDFSDIFQMLENLPDGVAGKAGENVEGVLKMLQSLKAFSGKKVKADCQLRLVFTDLHLPKAKMQMKFVADYKLDE